MLGFLAAGGALSLAVAAYEQPAAGSGQPARKSSTVEKLKDNLFMLKGGGGNTAVFVGANGVTVVDTKNPGWGQPILDKIKELTPKPVTTIINTHTHGDHVSGNVEFPATVDVVVQENTAENMKKMEPVTGLAAPGATPAPNIFDAERRPRHGEADVQGQDDDRRGADRDRSVLLRPRPHQRRRVGGIPGAARRARRRHVLRQEQLPILDANNGGSGVDYPDTLKKAYGKIKNIDTIITGHSGQMVPNDLKEYVDFIRQFVFDVQAAKKAGKTVDEVANTWAIPATFIGYTKPPTDRLKAYVQVIYNETK